MGLTGFVIFHVLIAPFSPAQGERNQVVNTKFTRPVNEMPMSTSDSQREKGDMYIYGVQKCSVVQQAPSALYARDLWTLLTTCHSQGQGTYQ